MQKLPDEIDMGPERGSRSHPERTVERIIGRRFEANQIDAPTITPEAGAGQAGVAQRISS